MFLLRGGLVGGSCWGVLLGPYVMGVLLGGFVRGDLVSESHDCSNILILQIVLCTKTKY